VGLGSLVAKQCLDKIINTTSMLIHCAI
jgi:hypothetical protein